MEVKDLGTYIHFTKEEKDRAANTDIEQFLLDGGEALICSGKDKRLSSDHSITIRGNEWFDHSAQKGGTAISFAQKHYDCGYADAVSMLLGGQQTDHTAESEPPKVFVLPPANASMRRVFAYLIKERSIHKDVLAAFAHLHLVYEDAEYHNAVFVGMDEGGTPRHAHKRSTNTYGKTFHQNVEGSDPKCSFNYIGNDGSLYVFEAPIDMLSYISLNRESWQDYSYVACCGTSALPVLALLRSRLEIREVYLCLDNDPAGIRAADKLKELLTSGTLYVQRLLPRGKDWNDDLKSLRLMESEMPK